jgi:protein-S-isoprenylcysteine O-methyltransferase Ste14
MEAKLLLVPWFATVLYSSIPLFWFAIHPFAGRWQTMKRSPYRALLPLWLVIIVALGGITWPWREVQLYSFPAMWLPVVILLALALLIYPRMSQDFGPRRISGEAELRPREHEQELVMTGAHARMRHPIYITHLINMAAWTLISGMAVNFVLLALSVLITYPIMIAIEERELEKRFGKRFRDYKSRVPIFPLPFLRASR